MNRTKIDWCDSTWNPVTGCYHNCEYCYARKMATRFNGGYVRGGENGGYCLSDKAAKYIANPETSSGKILIAQHYPIFESPGILNTDDRRYCAYPFGFCPTLHENRLNDYKNKKGRNIFVCSMADLFGDWVPDSWIQSVFDACKAAPQHRYLFLTKNPERYCKLADAGKLPEFDNFWYGSTITKPGESMFAGGIHWNTFLSIEPLLAPLDVGIGSFGGAKWIIVGAETGNRAGKVIPERAWVEKIIDAARLTGAAVFLKNSLLEVMEGEFIQEYPWGDAP